jgi:hypothetical protein
MSAVIISIICFQLCLHAFARDIKSLSFNVGAHIFRVPEGVQTLNITIYGGAGGGVNIPQLCKNWPQTVLMTPDRSYPVHVPNVPCLYNNWTKLSVFNGDHLQLNTDTNGLGGIISSTFKVEPKTEIYMFVGGIGQNTYGGFNGGGGPFGGAFAGGGGSSDIRIGGTLLSNRVMVAGGGGGGLRSPPLLSYGDERVKIPGVGYPYTNQIYARGYNNKAGYYVSQSGDILL